MLLAKALEMLEQAGQGEEPIGMCPETGKPVYLKTGRFGPYVQRGTPEDEEKPQNASLLKGMTPSDITLEVALKLLSLPRTLGVQAEGGEPIIAQNGRFGPYIKCGTETRSLPAGTSPLEVTLEEAIALLAQPKQARRGFGATRTPLKEFGPSPVTKSAVQLFEGRYGHYVTDGETNASLPKGLSVEELTLERALELLAERAAAGPSKKKGGRSAKKSAAPKKKAATKKGAARKPATKKSASS
jgi:DNA topoisomerase-1